MSFWTWLTSDAPGDEIVDEKWDGRMEKLADITVDVEFAARRIIHKVSSGRCGELHFDDDEEELAGGEEYTYCEACAGYIAVSAGPHPHT